MILADLAARLAASTGAVVAHRQELGGTRLLWDALLANEIDIYPEYTGTLKREILANEDVVDEASLHRALATRNLSMSRPLGFGDSYALGMMRQTAKRLGIENISDLARHPALRFGLSDEFLSRQDGWPAICLAYGLNAVNPRGMDHDIAYKGLADGSIDVIDLYTTDPEVGYYGVETLADDRHQFADNQAVLIYRADLERRAPKALYAMLRLEGAIDDRSMIEMNKSAKIDRRPETQVAAAFLTTTFGLANVERDEGLTSRLVRRTTEHLRLNSSLARRGDCRRSAAWRHRREAPGAWSCNIGYRQRATDNPIAGATGVHDSDLRYWSGARHRGALPLQSIAHHSEHGLGNYKHFPVPAQFRDSAWAHSDAAAQAN